MMAITMAKEPETAVITAASDDAYTNSGEKQFVSRDASAEPEVVRDWSHDEEQKLRRKYDSVLLTVFIPS